MYPQCLSPPFTIRTGSLQLWERQGAVRWYCFTAVDLVSLCAHLCPRVLTFIIIIMWQLLCRTILITAHPKDSRSLGSPAAPYTFIPMVSLMSCVHFLGGQSHYPFFQEPYPAPPPHPKINVLLQPLPCSKWPKHFSS